MKSFREYLDKFGNALVNGATEMGGLPLIAAGVTSALVVGNAAIHHNIRRNPVGRVHDDPGGNGPGISYGFSTLVASRHLLGEGNLGAFARTSFIAGMMSDTNRGYMPSVAGIANAAAAAAGVIGATALSGKGGIAASAFAAFRASTNNAAVQNSLDNSIAKLSRLFPGAAGVLGESNLAALAGGILVAPTVHSIMLKMMSHNRNTMTDHGDAPLYGVGASNQAGDKSNRFTKPRLYDEGGNSSGVINFSGQITSGYDPSRLTL